MAKFLHEEKSVEKRPLGEIVIFADFPSGPLSPYRHQATFDWKTLRVAIDGEDRLLLKAEIWEYLRSREIFACPTQSLSVDEQRKITRLRLRTFREMASRAQTQIAQNPRLHGAFAESATMYNIEMVGLNKISYVMFPQIIKRLGTEKHHKFVEDAINNKIVGCFCLTEVAHGSNASGMLTTATHDVLNDQFVLHSSSFDAAKFWAGGLGKCATHAIIYAKLVTSDGKDQGLHAFVVPLRCPETLKPFPGVIVGDLGEKIGLNGIDNGFLMFNYCRIPADNLLNKLGDVDKNGKYIPLITNAKKRLGVLLGVLSSGRIHITIISTNQMVKAITTAVRYSAVRKQFGPEDSKDEWSVIEYQQQQYRLFPYIAAAYATKIFGLWLSEINSAHVTNMSSTKNPINHDPEKAIEIHAIASSSKPFVSWMARDGIQVCREACGGHGYLKAAGIGDWRNENDANCTYEGENSILIQQTSNWLLGLWKEVNKEEKVVTPYGSAEFLNHHEKLPKRVVIKSTKEAVNPEVSLSAYKWLVCYYLRLTSAKIERLATLGRDAFTIRNDTQSYHAVTLSIVFIEHAILDRFYKFAMKLEDSKCRDVLLRLVSLYGAWNVEKHLGTLYMGNFLCEEGGQYIRDGVIELCASIKPDAVSLVDTIAPPDFILNSVLGHSDGQVYQHLQSRIFSDPETFVRATWWKEVTSNQKLPSKL